MADSSSESAAASQKALFWGCFIALVTTAFGFITRLFLIGTWAAEFKLDPAQAGRLAGIGIWPFAVSIIGFSLFIDRIGYKVAMFLAFAGHLIWTIMGVSAYFVSHGANPDTKTAYELLYWGSLILGLANGTVESFINPVVATMFSKEKTKWLNILHAGWPGGLVIAGMTVIFMGDVKWGIKIGIIGLPAIVYFVMLLGQKFPVQERVQQGVTTKEMLSEFGVLGAAIVGGLVTLQLMDFFQGGSKILFIIIGLAIVAGFGAYTKALGRLLMFFLVLIMIPLATTEIGTDGWITSIMEGIAKEKFHPGWILVYTSAIMMVLRFFAGPIVHKLSPLGLLTVSSVLAIGGLLMLSSAAGAMIFIAATLYGFGKTFFWPTMLGVVSEQTPKGGALTLNAISGIGMLAVGTLGFPYIGALQADKQIQAVVSTDAAKKAPGLVENGKLTTVVDKSIYEVIKYHTIDDEKLGAAIAKLPAADQKAANESINNARGASNQGALGTMAFFPSLMLASYIALVLYFKTKGGYKPVQLAAAAETKPAT
ncbi:MAG TPA: MFS transporter [Planctomycetota bacterium]|jgi:MFS family permease|nr:MFS transporter [Planctomycetota bacterium]